MKKFSVVIPTYNGIGIVDDCLKSILRFNDIGDDLEVIVSDNSLTTQLVEFVQENYSWVKIVKNENIGFGGACNRGFDISSGEYVLFLNPDTVLVESIFNYAIDKFENDENLGLFGVQLLNADLSNGFSFGFSEIYSLLRSWRAKRAVKRNKFKDNKMFISGADIFIRRNTFIEAGKFDENIFMYFEESDLIRRIKLYSNAKKIAFFGDKRIIHLGGATESTNGNDMQRALNQAERIENSSKYYAEKYGISYIKILNYRIRTVKIKKLICKIKKSGTEQIDLLNKLLLYYKKRLHSLKTEKK